MILRSLLIAVAIFSAAAVRAEEAGKPYDPPMRSFGDRIMGAVAEPPTENMYALANELEQKLRASGEDAEKIAAEVLAVLPQVVKDPAVVNFVESLAKEKPVLAARLLAQVARAGQIVRNYDGASIAVGQLAVEDEKLDPVMVLAQMPILEEGYFAGEIGDLKRPLCFRAHGYEDLDVTLAAEKNTDSGDDDDDGEKGIAILVGKVTLRPVPQGRRATLRGRIVLDASQDASSATLTLNASVPPVNTPHGGFSPRMSWPEGIKVEVDESGEFTAEGLSPSKYNVMVSAEGHVQKYQPFTLDAGEITDAGDVRLFASDLGFYIGHEAPETPELAWETDFKTALERSKKESRPLMVMMTATWCGPCKMLESETLADPWIRHFLAKFVVVKAYEDREVEQKYGLNGYPTLVFCDSSGEQAHKTVGHQPPHSFASQCAKAINGLDAEMPAELQALIDKKIIQVE
jgi:thiol-disulfide isomerase/thioredoxin